MIPFSASKLIIIMRINKIIAKFITFNGKASMLTAEEVVLNSQPKFPHHVSGADDHWAQIQEDEWKLKVITPNEIF